MADDLSIRVVRLTEAGWAVAAHPSALPIAVHAAADSAIEHARRDLAETPSGGRIDVYEGVTVTRSIPVSGTAQSASEKAASGFDTVMPWLILVLPGAITWLFGSSAPQLFAPGVLEASDTLWGAILATLAWSLAVAAFTFISRTNTFDSWLPLAFTAVGCLAAANLVAWLFNLQTFADSPIIPLYTHGAFPQMFLGTILGTIGAGTVAFGWGGVITGGIAGAIAGWTAADKWDI